MNFKRFHESKNLLQLSSIAETSLNGVTYRVQGNSLYIDGKSTAAFGIDIRGTFTLNAGTYTNQMYGFTGRRVYYSFNNVSDTMCTSDVNTYKTFTISESTTYAKALLWINNDVVFDNERIDFALFESATPKDFEPYSSEVWHDTPHYIHNTATDTITTLPADIYANDITATVGLKGNMSQSSQPSPTTPIQPQETGERTGNLWNEEGFSAKAITSTHEHTDTNTYGTTLSTTIGKETIITQSEYPTGTVGYQNGFFFIDVDFSKYEIGDKVTLSFDYICNEVHSIEGQISTTLYAGKNSNIIPVVLSSGKWSVSGRLTAVITVIADMNPYVEVRLCGNSITVKNIMLNSGSTALPYEPFGVKIPISSANTTTPVYLGEVQSTRKIRKLVFDGSENWRQSSDGNIYISLSPNQGVAWVRVLSTHFTSSQVQTNGGLLWFVNANVDFDTVEECKTYLQQQYAAGIPVTVWYVLATPTTGIVNEPLRKIGDYADEVSGITIPTTAGVNTISVGTTLQPSEVSVNYKGWHPVADVHEAENGQWD